MWKSKIHSSYTYNYTCVGSNNTRHCKSASRRYWRFWVAASLAPVVNEDVVALFGALQLPPDVLAIPAAPTLHLFLHPHRLLWICFTNNIVYINICVSSLCSKNCINTRRAWVLAFLSDRPVSAHESNWYLDLHQLNRRTAIYIKLNTSPIVQSLTSQNDEGGKVSNAPARQTTQITATFDGYQWMQVLPKN
jgi:hypothetical protein